MSYSIELEHYIQRKGLEPLKRRILKRQAADLQKSGETHCGCGQPINALNSFRCVYCGLWLCVTCAEIHFGITRKDYDESPD